MQDAIQSLLEGKVDPKDIKIPGIETDEEKAEKEVSLANPLQHSCKVVE